MGFLTGVWRLMFPKRRNDWKLPEIIVATVLLLLIGGAITFGIGINHLSNNEIPNPPPKIKTDSSFYLLLSQSLVNILISACTISGIIKDGFDTLTKSIQIWLPIFISVIFAIAAPPTYAATDEVQVGNQTNGMIVSFVSSVFAVLAAVFSSNVANYERI